MCSISSSVKKSSRLKKLSSAIAFFRRGILLFLFRANPRLRIVWLVCLRIRVGVILGLRCGSWGLFSVVLLFTGGIIVLLSYILRLISSSKIRFSIEPRLILVLIVWLMFTTNFDSCCRISHLRDLYNLRFNSILYFLAIYLFLVLIVVVKLSIRFIGPLKIFCSHEI